MILFKFIIGFFFIFISPIIYIRYKYSKLKLSIVLLYAFGISFAITWFLILLGYVFKLPNSFYFYLSLAVTLHSIFYALYNSNRVTFNNRWGYTLVIIGTFIISYPFFIHIGSGYSGWDAIVSWHRWALELYENQYHPIDAAYPVLLPALWALIYKIEGTSDIWWSSQISLVYIVFFTLLVILVSYYEYRKKSFIFMALLIYPYMLATDSYDGYMDMPIMFFGFLTLLSLYLAELNIGKRYFDYYIVAALVLAGVSAIVKQPGLAFLLFTILYIIKVRDKIVNKRLIVYIGVVVFLYILSYLILYITNSTYSPIGNIDHLKKLSNRGLTFSNNIMDVIESLWEKYFSYPPTINYFSLSIFRPTFAITPYLIGLGYILFLFKYIRERSKISILSGLIFPLSVLVWVFYFSYDEGDSFWTRAFFIIFASINFGYFVESNYFDIVLKRVKIIYLFLGIFLLIVYKSWHIKDKDIYKVQIAYQENIGDKKLAKYIRDIVVDKDCLSVYTDNYYMRFNYILHDVKGKVKTFIPAYRLVLLDYLKHNCNEGRYLIFRRTDRFNSEWWKLQRLVLRNYIYETKFANNYVFFIPANINLPKEFFKYHTEFDNIEIKNIVGKLKAHLDILKNREKYIVLVGWLFPELKPTVETKKYIILQSKNRRYIIRAYDTVRQDVVKHFKNKGVKIIASGNVGFKSYINKNELEEGVYDVRLLAVDVKTKQEYVLNLNYKVQIKKEYNEK